jgi:hypothetical protein
LLAYAPVGQGRQPLGGWGEGGRGKKGPGGGGTLGRTPLEVSRGPVAEELLASPRAAVGC